MSLGELVAVYVVVLGHKVSLNLIMKKWDILLYLGHDYGKGLWCDRGRGIRNSRKRAQNDKRKEEN